MVFPLINRLVVLTTGKWKIHYEIQKLIIYNYLKINSFIFSVLHFIKFVVILDWRKLWLVKPDMQNSSVKV